MSNYTKSTNFAAKDALASGNPSKIVKGTEIDTEFNNIATAIATKTDNSSANITGGSITGITDLAVADGGTGASTASDARTNLGAASSGANSDITSLSGLTTALSVAQGGTGSTTAAGARTSLNAMTYVAPSTSGNVLTSNGTDWVSSTPASISVDVQTFDSTGTWTKPTGGQKMARIQVWGGGGGGSRSTSANYASGGGGGGYNEATVPLSYLASSLTATVGSGGAGATSAGDGGIGGTSQVPLATAVNGRSAISATGGGGGSFGYGGGGGAQLTAGSIGGAAGSPRIRTTAAGENLGDNQVEYGLGGIWTGGGGGRLTGASSVFGGGGGGVTDAGSSVYGGAGGSNIAGTQPGGGGGASSLANTNGSNGAAGRIIITCW